MISNTGEITKMRSIYFLASFLVALGYSLGPTNSWSKEMGKKEVAKEGRNSEYLFNNIIVSFGNWMEFVDDVQITKGGTKNSLFLSQYTPYFSISVDYPFKENWGLIPEIGYVVQREAADSRISKNLFFVRSDVAYLYNKWLRLRAGTSLMILNITGTGGEETLPNGDSTETYFIPSQRRTALNQTLDFGIEGIYDRLSLRLGSYIYAWNENADRMVTYSFSLNYLIPLKEL